jgi:hypothetical protein
MTTARGLDKHDKRARARLKWIDVHALCVFSAAQREACAASFYRKSTRAGRLLPALYDDGGFSGAAIRKKARCAIYTRKSSEEGLEQAFNSLGGTMERPALKRLRSVAMTNSPYPPYYT